MDNGHSKEVDVYRKTITNRYGKRCIVVLRYQIIHGFGPFWSLLSGIVIFSGTVQFVSVTMLSTGSYIMAAVTALMVAARHIFFSISMISRYKDSGYTGYKNCACPDIWKRKEGS